MFFRSCMSLLLGALLASAVAAQSQVKWESSLDAALARAKAEGKPLLISMHTSTEIACQRMLTNLYRDPAIVPILNEFVVLPTCFDDHEETEVEIDGEKRRVSPLFQTVGCDVLRKNEADVRERYFETSKVTIPQHIFVGDDGKIYLQKIYELKKPAFITLLNNALILYGGQAADGMDPVTKTYLEKIRKGTEKERRHAVRGVLEFEDQRKLDILYLTIQGLKKESEKAECVRAFGREQFSWAAPTVMKWLRDPAEHIRHCAVVSLEEMKAKEAAKTLLEMHGKARSKDKELKKDILRALGPCTEASEEARKLLVSKTKDRSDVMRIGAYLSLGYYLENEDVREVLAKRFKKEKKNIAAKTAILWAYSFSGDEELIPSMEALVAKEKNRQLHYIANAAALKIKTGSGVAKSEGRGGYAKLRKALGAIYSRDKILRNAYQYWKGDD